MIKIENTEVFGWKAAIRGMRNPMNSWDKSDSFKCNGVDCRFEDCPAYIVDDDDAYCSQEGTYIIGENDLDLMKKLVKAGTDHSKFMRMINVTMDITAPMYWWKELDTYKVGTVRNSCSTMHKIAEKEFTLDDFSHEHMTKHNTCLLMEIIEDLNLYRNRYITAKETDGMKPKDWWWQMIQLLPSSYNQRATVQLNYAVLRNMHHARKNHRLDEWKEFCKCIETLPYSELITSKGENDE